MSTIFERNSRCVKEQKQSLQINDFDDNIFSLI